MESDTSHNIKQYLKARLIPAIGVVIVAAGILLWLGLSRGAVYSYSVSELKALGSAQHVRVSGGLEGGSLVHSETGFTFTLYDRESSEQKITVVYDGALADTFKNDSGAEVAAEGDYDGAGRFLAETLITE